MNSTIYVVYQYISCEFHYICSISVVKFFQFHQYPRDAPHTAQCREVAPVGRQLLSASQPPPPNMLPPTTSSSNTQYVASFYFAKKIWLLQNCLRHTFYCRLSYVGFSHTFLSVIQKMASFYFGKKYQLHLSLTTNSGLRHLIISFRLIYIMLKPLP